MSTKTVSVICFLRYGKLLSCKVKNAPRGCTTRGDEYIATLSARVRKCAQAHTLLYNTKKRSFK